MIKKKIGEKFKVNIKFPLKIHLLLAIIFSIFNFSEFSYIFWTLCLEISMYLFIYLIMVQDNIS